MNFSQISGLKPTEKRTFSLHLSYSVIEGILAGLIALNEFVFVKSLLGSSYQVSILFQFATLVFILLIFFNEFLRRIKDKKGLLRRTAIITRLPLLLLFFFPRSPEQLTGDSVYHYIFLAIFLAYYLANPIVFPSINLFLKNAYSHENFGRLYSHATTVNKIVMMITTFVYGWMLDADNYIFVYVFPVAAILGMVSIFLLSMIPYRECKRPEPSQTLWQGIRQSISQMSAVLKKNTPYRHFQSGFMFYGFGFMGSYTVIILFFEYGLGLNYSSVAFYRNAYNILAIAMLPFFGKLIGRIDPRRFATISFLSMVVFIFSLIMTRYMDGYADIFGIRIYYTMLGYIFFHGIFAATMSLIWSIGSAYFCAPSEAGIYQSIHLGLTALRSLFAPLLGVLFYELWGFTIAFAIAIAMLLTGSLIMLWSEKNYPLIKKERTKPEVTSNTSDPPFEE
jgi:Na+/melibiose symporter-like transporter